MDEAAGVVRRQEELESEETGGSEGAARDGRVGDGRCLGERRGDEARPCRCSKPE
jgi:hypothetical protein